MYADSFEDITRYFQDKDRVTVSTTASSSGRPIPFYRKHLWAWMSALFSTIISLGVFGGLAIAGLLATPFISIPIIFAVLAIVLVVKIAMDHRSSSMSSNVADHQNWPEYVATSESTASKRSQNVFAEAQQKNQKLIEEQSEHFRDFLLQKGASRGCFNIDVSFPNSGPVLNCTLVNSNSTHQQEELGKLRQALSTEKNFVYDENIAGLTISVADFEKIYKPSPPSNTI